MLPALGMELVAMAETFAEEATRPLVLMAFSAFVGLLVYAYYRSVGLCVVLFTGGVELTAMG